MKRLSLIAILILTILALSACTDPVLPGENNSNNNLTTIPIITISEAGIFTLQDCQDRGLENKIVMIESKYCGHCEVAKPIFEEACQEAGVIPEILDITEKDQRTKMISYSVDVKYTPTFIINCSYYIGGMKKEEYINLING